MRIRAFLLIACSGCFFIPTPHSAHAHTLNPTLVEKITGQTIAEDVTVQSKDPRYEERTFASFPEWYIVYNAQEYSAFVAATNTPSQFPYFASIQQYWNSVAQVQAAIGSSTIDSNTKTVLRVIGVSFSIENGVIGAYEKTVGRLFEVLSFSIQTPEDRYTETAARDYGQFLLHTPWYAFPYGHKLFGLWTTWGWASFTPRGIERRIAFTIGYTTKGIYGTILGKLSEASLGTAQLRTSATVANISAAQLASVPDVEVTEEKEGYVYISAPRYRAFTPIAEAIVARGGTFVAIEGHETIMLSVIADPDTSCLTGLTIPFALPILTQRERSRVLITTEVSRLREIFMQLQACDIAVEHIYDY